MHMQQRKERTHFLLTVVGLESLLLFFFPVLFLPVKQQCNSGLWKGFVYSFLDGPYTRSVTRCWLLRLDETPCSGLHHGNARSKFQPQSCLLLSLFIFPDPYLPNEYRN